MYEVEDFSAEIVEDSNQFMVSNGIMFKQDMCKDTYSYIPAPICLKPSKFNKEVYSSIRNSQPTVNLFIAKLMENISKVHQILGPISEIDPFIANLLKLSKAVQETSYKQLGYLGILRTDYMVTDDNQPKLVELNTIASGLGAVSDQMKGLYSYLIDKHYQSDSHSQYSNGNLAQDCKNTEAIAESMKKAYDLYIASKSPSFHKKIMAYIVDYSEANILDQKLIEKALYEKHGIVSRRLTFADISEFCELKETGELVYKGREEIALVYYRSGYSPSQYNGQSDWDAREMLEKSLAIKCPSVDLHLLTFKKIQEVLSDPEIWSDLLGEGQFSEIQPLFDGQMWGFETMDEQTLRIIEDAKAHPEKYVLKTQREGGGNNYFGDDIPYILEQTEKLMNYSLMKKIEPKEFEGVFLRNNKVYQGKCVSEIGIFGQVLVKFNQEESPDVLFNKDSGFLLRTKGSGTNEGGVYGGFSFIDYVNFE